MDLNDIIHARRPVTLAANEQKIPWDEPEFSQRMLENHLSQQHDWASRRFSLIEQQVEWIAGQLPAGARILDLGCGPGFYTQRLASRGFRCTGVDFSPAAIDHARREAQRADLSIHYQQQDVRRFVATTPQDLIMMTFGEFNVFSAGDARHLLSHIASQLRPGGWLLLEVHTFQAVQNMGMAQPRWESCPQGLFLAEPHLLLTESAWNAATQTASTLWWAITPSGVTRRFGSQTQAWRDEEYLVLLEQYDFRQVQRLPEQDWPSGSDFTDSLYVLLARKAQDI
nr:class I SAM-dependent methyltransferase [Entomohabitans teleogrylli]